MSKYLHRAVNAAGLALVLLLGFGSASPPVSVAARSQGATESVLFSPDLNTHPNGTGGYPRALELQHTPTGAPELVATFAKSGTAARGSMPIMRSVDGGSTWSQEAEIFSNTPGWTIEAPTLFEVPRDVNGLHAGDLLAAGTAWRPGDYTQQKIEIFKSIDHGATWQFLSVVTQTSGLPNTWGHGIWEPTFLIDAQGRLLCFISDERPAGSPTNAQKIGHYSSSDGGHAWSTDIQDDVVFPKDPLARPGMQTFAHLPDGRFVMSYELCRDATDPDHACEVYIKFSDDGANWGAPGTRGTLVQTADHRELLHTPYVSWSPEGGSEGTLLLSGQRVVAGPTGLKTVQSESGTVLLANKSLGRGAWVEIKSPLTITPTGGYADGVPSCPGYSTPAIPLRQGGFLFLASTWLGRGNQCEVRVGIGEVPGPIGRVTAPGGKCLDVDTNTSVNGNRAQVWTCGIAEGQRWTHATDGSLRSLGKCLDVDAQGTANHTPVQLWECNGSGAQQWVEREDGSLLNPQSGKCLDVPKGNTADGTKLEIYDCNGLWSQRWGLPH